MSKYEKRGVSADKTDVHQAIKNLDKGLFPNAFCKVLPDMVAGSDAHCNVMHADTAGTKTSLAYLYWKETGDLSVWKNIIQDALVMNLDDMACVGITDDIVLSNTIGRNKTLISGEVLKTLIQATAEFGEKMAKQGIQLHLSGGETADVGDIVRTIDVGFTTFARTKRSQIIENNIKEGDVIVSLASYGQATYEDDYNSGIGSNGLTFARHEVLKKEYAAKYPESFDPNISEEVVYTGKTSLTDIEPETGKTVGQLLLSPTRTYLPLIKALITEQVQLNGMIHCSGGGQTKVLHFTDDKHIVKDDLLPIPPVFRMIQSQTGAAWEELFKVFNMGARLELYLPEAEAEKALAIAKNFNIDAKVSGYCKKAANGQKASVEIKHQGETYTYRKL